MTQAWPVVYQADEEYKAEIIRQLLEGNNLHPVIMDHKDDEFRIGQVEVLVPPAERDAAMQILANNQAPESSSKETS